MSKREKPEITLEEEFVESNTLSQEDWYKMSVNKSNGSAEIHIYEQIGNSFWDKGLGAKKFAQDLKDLGDVNEITVRINSPGGSVYEGNTIYNLLASHKATINVVIDGIAASIASIIAMAGDTITIAENGYFMIHNPMTGVFGPASDLRKMADVLDKLKKGLCNVYMSKTGMSEKQLSDLMDAETWMTADEAVGMGFADKVKRKAKCAATNFAMLNQFRNTPVNLLKNGLMSNFAYDAVPTSHVNVEKETPTMSTQTPAAQSVDVNSPEFQAALQKAVAAVTSPALAKINEERLASVRNRFTEMSKKGNLTPAQARIFTTLAEQGISNENAIKFSTENDGTNEMTGSFVDALFALADTFNHTLLQEQVATEKANGGAGGSQNSPATAKNWKPDLSNVPENMSGCVGGFVFDQYVNQVILKANPQMSYKDAVKMAERDSDLRATIASADPNFQY